MANEQIFIVEEDTIEIDDNALTGYALPPNTEDLTVTPTKQTQQFSHEEGTNTYYDTITVDPIPDEFIIPTGSQTITENGEYDITSKASVVVDVETKNFDLYNVQQVVHGNTCDLIINDAGTGQGTNMLLGEILNGDYSNLYLVEA